MFLKYARASFLDRISVLNSWMPHDRAANSRKEEGEAFLSGSDLGSTKTPPSGMKAKPMLLSEAKEGICVKILKVRGGGAIRQRLLDMGVAKGAIVKIVRYAPLMDPIHVSVRGYGLALRVAECSMIDVEPASAEESDTNA